MPIKDNLNKPAPRWLRIADGVIGDLEDVVLTIMLMKGYTADAPNMVIYKVASSFARRQLKRIVSNGEVYAKADTIEKTVTAVETTTIVDTTKPTE